VVATRNRYQMVSKSGEASMKERIEAVAVERPVAPEPVEHRDKKGRLQDPADGSPARVEYYPDGTIRLIEHFQRGRRQDPADGSPATVSYHPDGSVRCEPHWHAGQLRDGADGAPAVSYYNPDDTLRHATHYRYVAA
jgi:hypothetical protein